MLKSKKGLLKLLKLTFGFILLLLLSGFLLRSTVLNQLLNSRFERIGARTGLNIQYKEAGFTGLSTVFIEQLSFKPPHSDTLLTVKRVSIHIRTMPLLLLKIRFANLEVTDPLINLVRNGTESNYLLLLDLKKSDTTTKHTDSIPPDYAARVSALFNAAFRYVPSEVNIRNFNIVASINRHNFSFGFPELSIAGSEFSTLAAVTDDSLHMQWHLSGILDPSGRNVAIKIATAGTGKVQIPYIASRWQTVLAFDSASFNMGFSEAADTAARITGEASVYGPLINNPRLSPQDIAFNFSRINYNFTIGKSFIQLDSTSVIRYNLVAFHPFVRYDFSPAKQLTLRINEPDFSARDFFGSFPAGLFTNFEGIKVKGRLGFYLSFVYPVASPDSIQFNAWLTSKGFAVEKFGKTNFGYINEPFVYTAFEKGEPVRQFVVGPENREYRPLSAMPGHLQKAVMTSEDGQFFNHRGFLPDAIRESIITDIKEKRFARGGSTISMQLVKNVFLNRNKNITRKLEEMLITWMIESQHLVSKERMFEVYLNIIEMGPMVYGMNEASQFYFKKDVSKLTLAESIYLASIIPKPKWFKYSFDQNGNLREYLQSYYSLVSTKMLKKEWITQDEFNELRPVIELKGPARLLVVPADSIPLVLPDEEPDFE